MTTYIFDNTLDGLLTAVFDSFALHQQPQLLAEGEQLPLFADEPHRVVTDEEKAARVWKGLEKHLSREALRIISISWMSEERTLNQPLFNYICKVFQTGKDLSHNASDPDVLFVRNTCRRVLHEEQRMKQFIRFQKAKDGTYLAVVAPDHNVLPLIIDHFQDRFNDQSWLIYDARRHYGYYYGSPSLAQPDASLPSANKDKGGCRPHHLRGRILRTLRPYQRQARCRCAQHRRPTVSGPLAHLLQGHLHPRAHQSQETTQRHAPPLLALHDGEKLVTEAT